MVHTDAIARYMVRHESHQVLHDIGLCDLLHAILGKNLLSKQTLRHT